MKKTFLYISIFLCISIAIIISCQQISILVSDNCELSKLTISSGTLSPGFSSRKTNYTCSVSNDTTSVTVKPTATETNSSIKVNGKTVKSGNNSQSITLNLGSNTITIVITAQDSSEKTYTITVTRLSNTDLLNLTISEGTLTPSFSSDITYYSCTVNNSITNVTVTPTKASSTATIEVQVNDGGYAIVNSGSPSVSLSLNVGDNTIDVLVTGQYGATNIYSIIITRLANSQLSSLTISSGTLDPSFSTETMSYTANSTATSITVTPTKINPNATIEVQVNNGGYSPVASGNPSGDLDLNIGDNTIDIKITAEDNSYSIYVLLFSRISASSLSDLSISSGELSPVFSRDITYYSNVANSSSVTVTPTKADPDATIEVQVNNGGYALVTSGSPSGSLALDLGDNTIDIKVTALDMSYTNYYIKVKRWMFVDGNGSSGINYDIDENGYDSQLTAHDSKLYAIWHENNNSISQVRVVVYNGNDSSPSWSFVDGNGDIGINKDSSEDTDNAQLVSFNSKLYATWSEENGSGIAQVRVCVYNGNDSSPSWSFVDGDGADGINKSTTRGASVPQLTEYNSKLYATWSEVNSSNDSQVRVCVYNGNDSSPSWSFVDGNLGDGINKDPSEGAWNSQLTIFDSKLYAIWQEKKGSITQIRVCVYNGNDSSPSWSFVDGDIAYGINKDTGENARYPQLTVHNSKLYVTWTETYNSYFQFRVCVYSGNDSSPSWSFVDGNGDIGINKDATENAEYPQLTSFGSNLYAIWHEFDIGMRQCHISQYNGNDSSPSWNFVDGNGTYGINKDPNRHAEYPQLTVFDSKMYAIWYELNNPGSEWAMQIRVKVGK